MTRLSALASGLFRLNPIIVKEIRSRMRGPRVFITLTIILLVMGSAMYAVLQLIMASSRYTNILSPQIGQSLFASLAFMELFMICAVTPAVTAGAISSEKEKQTYEMLMATPLSPTSILWGKLISALSYVLLLLFAAVPLASVVFIFGGVAPREMLKALAVLLGTAISYGILGLFMSALFGRSGRATVASFLVVALFMFGPLFLAVLVGVLRNGEPPRWILTPSPISALSAALAPSMATGGGADVFYALSGLFNVGVSTVSQTSIPRPLYHFSIPFYTILSLVLYMLSTRLVQPTRRWRLKKREVLTGLLALLVIGGLMAGAFFLTTKNYEGAKNPNIAPTEAPQIFPGGGAGIVVAQAVPAQVVTHTPVEEAATTTPPPNKQPAATSANPATQTPGGPTATPANPPTRTPAGPTATAPAKLLAVPATLETFEAADQAAIYAAIVRQFYTVDHTFEKQPDWTGLYLVITTDDTVGDPNAPRSKPVVLPKPVTGMASEQLQKLGPKIQWVDTKDSVAKDPKTGVIDNGKSAMITFGSIYPQKDGSVAVSASLYFGSLGGTGKTYILQQVNGVWTIVGSVGVQWIS